MRQLRTTINERLTKMEVSTRAESVYIIKSYKILLIKYL